MVQWRQQIQNSFGRGSIPSPASSGSLAPATAPAAAAMPAATPASRAGAAAGAASIPAAATTCPPLRVSEMARIRAGRPVRVKGGNCLMEFN
jgi:hypothetical protein